MKLISVICKKKFTVIMTFSNIGFGSYRISNKIEQHYTSLRKALSEGINLIDTSANYADGESEILIGRVLKDMINENIISRKDITLVTKAGYIQGQNYRRAIELKKEGKLYSDTVELQDKLWHCISPEFLDDQINRQLERLGTEYADVYLLHNPEYYLDCAKKDVVEKSEARKIYYERIKKAFVHLEKKVEEGKIKSYGISSNTFPGYADDYSFTSLEEILKIAASISENNNFKVIQLPFNLAEAGAVTIKNQFNKTKTVLELASEAGLKVLINRPLNAITAKGLVRLSDFSTEPFLEKDFIQQMKHLSLLEEEIINNKLVGIEIDESTIENFKKNLNFGKTIEESWKFFGSIEHFNDTVNQIFAQKINLITKTVEENIKDENLKDHFAGYIKDIFKLLNYVSKYYKLRAAKRSDLINSLINKKLDEKFRSLTLSQKSVLLLNSVKGVSCVLAGMRKDNYIEDLIPVLGRRDITNAEEIIKYVSMEIQSAEI
jgi:aryl-alcohol dehydrogenase-like predicted oxidoreductase